MSRRASRWRVERGESGIVKIKVLVVDDSALMRRYMREILGSDPDLEVYVARNGQEGLNMVKEVDPAVVTLDINMPEMDGLTCLSHIMSESPRPVLMVSSLTTQGALSTFEALELGAVDYIPKPDGTVSRNIKKISAELIAKVRSAARSRIRRSQGLRARLRTRKGGAERRSAVSSTSGRPTVARVASVKTASLSGLLLIGASTGGPRTLERILGGLPADFPHPVLVAQHMPGHFTRVFAERLAQDCQMPVDEVDQTIPLEPGRILIGKGDADVLVGRRGGRRVALCVPPSNQYLWHPSVERMVRTAMEHFSPTDLTAVQLTGMGHDGADGMAELHRLGGRTIAESAETAVVFGMPQELIAKGGATVVLPCDRIAGQLCAWTHGERIMRTVPA